MGAGTGGLTRSGVGVVGGGADHVATMIPSVKWGRLVVVVMGRGRRVGADHVGNGGAVSGAGAHGLGEGRVLGARVGRLHLSHRKTRARTNTHNRTQPSDWNLRIYNPKD